MIILEETIDNEIIENEKELNEEIEKEMIIEKIENEEKKKIKIIMKK